MVDTGGSVTCISASLSGIQAMRREPTDVRLVAASGSSLECVGQVSTDVTIGAELVRNGVQRCGSLKISQHPEF